MTPEEHIKRFEKTIDEVSRHGGGEMMVKLGIEANRKIFDRVHGTGMNAKGAKFPPYSTRPMLVGCKSFPQKEKCNMLFGSKEKRRELDWRTVKGKRLAILQGGYRQWRQIYGAQVDHVDFSVTNRMWNNINIVSNTNNHQSGEVIIGARGEDNKEKLAGNTKRKGDILDLSPKEILDLYRTYNLQVLQVFRNNGL